MRFDKYEITIPQAVEKDGYCILNHGQEFSIRISNHESTRCNVKIKVDGKDIGTFRLNAKQSSNLEHPVQHQHKFVFCIEGTLKGGIAGLDKIPPEDLGLIKAQFLPEKVEETLPGGSNFATGGTGAGSVSTQEYGCAPPMTTDIAKAVTIYLRLVGRTPSDIVPPKAGPRSTSIPPLPK